MTDLVERYNLGDIANRYSGKLSGGQRQRLALAAAVVQKPKLLFLDEPTSAVDPESRRDFWEQLFDLSDAGTSIVVSTHFMDEAEYCDRIALMYHAKVIALDTPDQIKRQAAANGRKIETMEDAFIAMVESPYNRLIYSSEQTIVFNLIIDFQWFKGCPITAETKTRLIRQHNIPF